MLYTSTRDPVETYTCYHALNEDRAPDGGFFVPLRLPEIDVESFRGKTMNQVIAEILNICFSVQLTGREIDLVIGKAPVRLRTMNHRILIAESWHNLDWDFSRMVRNLTALIRGTRDTEQPCGHWAEIAVRIGVLFGVFSAADHWQDPLDIVVPSSDFSDVMSAWYARKMGLPIGNIVICCNENNNLWELINHGQLRTGRVAQETTTPLCDQTVPEHLELLIYACGGINEVEIYRKACREGRNYFPDEDVLGRIREGLHATVVGRKRLEAAISGAYATHGYVFGPYSALAYAGLMDYRARTGANADGLILSEFGALLHDEYVAKTMGITLEKLNQILD